MAKRKPKPKKAKNHLLALRIKARRQRQIIQAAERAISQALSETLLQLAFEGGNQS